MEPMLATLAEAPLVDPNLVYEPKYDGIRALISVVPGASLRPGDHRLAPGQRQDRAVPRGRRGAHAAGAPSATRAALLDGEIVALDDAGEPARIRAAAGAHPPDRRPRGARGWPVSDPCAFVAFDLLRDGGDDLCALPLAERRVGWRRRSARGVDSTLRLARQVRGRRHGADGRGAQPRGGKGWSPRTRARPTGRGGARSSGESSSWSSARSSWSAASPSRAARAPASARCCWGCRPASGRLRYAGHVGGGFTDKELAHVGGPAARARKTATSPVRRTAAGQRAAALGPPGAGRRGAVRGVDDARATCGSRSISACATTSSREVAEHRGEAAGTASRRRGPPRPPPRRGPPRRPRRARETPVSCRRSPTWPPRFEALATRGSGRLELPGGAVLELGNLSKPLWPGAGPHQG